MSPISLLSMLFGFIMEFGGGSFLCLFVVLSWNPCFYRNKLFFDKRLKPVSSILPES